MNKLSAVTVADVTDNFDNLRIPLSVSQRQNLEKKYRYYGAQGVIDYVDRYIFDGDYILVAEDGENLKSQKNDICAYVEGQFWVNNHAHIIKANGKNDTKYIFYKLNQVNFRNYVTGSAQPKLTKDNLNSIVLHIHEPKDQQRIAKVLSTLDAKIELNNRINAELEAMAKTLYDYWFVQFNFPFDFAQGKPAANGKPYKSSGGKMVYNPTLKREIPEGWEANNVLKVTYLLGGGTPTKMNSEYWNGEIPFFTPSDSDSKIYSLKTEDYITQEGLKNSSTKLFPKNTVFITARGSVGRLALNAVPMAMNQSCYALQAKEGISYSYLFFLTKELIHHLEVKASGSVFNSIVSNDIEYTNLAIPVSTEVIKVYAKVAEQLFKKIEINIIENNQLEQLRDWLLPMLMNGQVTVQVAATD